MRALAIHECSDLTSSVVAEVRSAVASGKTVTIHQSQINAFGWSGAGYTIIDPTTGMGSYLIEGRGNGGWLLVAFGVLHLVVPLVVFLFAPELRAAVSGLYQILMNMVIMGTGEIVAGIGEITKNKEMCLLGISVFLSEFESLLPTTTSAFIMGPMRGMWFDYCVRIV